MLKRGFDFVISLLLLVCLLPILAIVTSLVFIKLGRPVFFKQLRPGLFGKPFLMLKFRTMLDSDLPDTMRLTRFGSFLRSTSLDELPELWNVLKGEMSLVGPRPLLMEYLPLYDEEQSQRHNVRPGITGWAQINGRNAISWEEKFKLDICYVNNRTFVLDLKILFFTLKKILIREGITDAGNISSAKFEGKSKSL